jgi:hypothetical protein
MHTTPTVRFHLIVALPSKIIKGFPEIAVVGSICGVKIGAPRQFLHHILTLPRQILMNLIIFMFRAQAYRKGIDIRPG